MTGVTCSNTMSSPFQLASDIAAQHARETNKCAHVACVVLVDGVVVNVKTNTRDRHAEISALTSLTIDPPDHYRLLRA